MQSGIGRKKAREDGETIDKAIILVKGVQTSLSSPKGGGQRQRQTTYDFGDTTMRISVKNRPRNHLAPLLKCREGGARGGV